MFVRTRFCAMTTEGISQAYRTGQM